MNKTIDWRKLFPKEFKTDTPDLVKDLMPLKMGVDDNNKNKPSVPHVY